MTSLQNSINQRGGFVITGRANRAQSDRIFNPANQVCFARNGITSTGRETCPYGYRDEMEGCNSADARVSVGNSLRPIYAGGFPLTNPSCGIGHGNASCVSTDGDNWGSDGHFNNNPGAVLPDSNSYAHADMMASAHQEQRETQYTNLGYKTLGMMSASGN